MLFRYNPETKGWDYYAVKVAAENRWLDPNRTYGAITEDGIDYGCWCVGDEFYIVVWPD